MATLILLFKTQIEHSHPCAPVTNHTFKAEVTFCVRGVISPMLSNIFLHHVLDKWFEDVVRPRMRGKATLVRFADDFVMTFETHYDAKRVMDVLGKRLDRFGLTLHPDKTRFIDFRPQRHGGTPPDCKAQSFDLLGFTHSWGKSRKGKNVVRQMTAKHRFARSLAAIKD